VAAEALGGTAGFKIKGDRTLGERFGQRRGSGEGLGRVDRAVAAAVAMSGAMLKATGEDGAQGRITAALERAESGFALVEQQGDAVAGEALSKDGSVTPQVDMGLRHSKLSSCRHSLLPDCLARERTSR